MLTFFFHEKKNDLRYAERSEAKIFFMTWVVKNSNSVTGDTLFQSKNVSQYPGLKFLDRKQYCIYFHVEMKDVTLRHRYTIHEDYWKKYADEARLKKLNLNYEIWLNMNEKVC